MEELIDVLNENGMFTDKTADRETIHKEGLWHRAVVVFVVNSKHQVLLQRRSANKKMWPNLWDLTAGGHVLTGEFGFQAAIREAKEEIDLDINKEDLLLIGSSRSTNIKGSIINNHFNEFYIVNKDVDISELKLQEDEVQDIKWFDSNDIIERIHSNYNEITDKIDCWDYLERYLKYTNSNLKH